MKMISALLSILIVLTLVGCGNGSDTPTTNTTDLTKLLVAKKFYAVEDNIANRNLLAITFDAKLTQWNIATYDKNYTTPSLSNADNNITVTSTTLVVNNITTFIKSQNSSYIELSTKNNPLYSLKLFTLQPDAQKYFDIDLRNELKGKEFFVVQNDVAKRSLFKISVNDTFNQWDVVSYATDYAKPTTAAYGLSIVVNDLNMTDSGATSFSFANKNETLLRLVSSLNTLITLDFYNTSKSALEYFNSKDLRKELKGKTFYSVGDVNGTKSLYKFVFNDTLTSWNFSVYDQNYTSAPVQDANNTIGVREDMLVENQGDRLYFEEKTTSYIGLQSLSTSTTNFRLYSDKNKALNYYRP